MSERWKPIVATVSGVLFMVLMHGIADLPDLEKAEGHVLLGFVAGCAGTVFADVVLREIWPKDAGRKRP